MNLNDIPDLMSDTSSTKSNSNLNSSPELIPYDKLSEYDSQSFELDYACISCNPNNQTGFICQTPYAILRKVSKPKHNHIESKNGNNNWHSNLIRGNKFRQIGIVNHDECVGCHNFIPIIHGLNYKCVNCNAPSCDIFYPNGCTRNFKLKSLRETNLPPYAKSWIMSNENTKKLLEKYGSLEALSKAIIDLHYNEKFHIFNFFNSDNTFKQIKEDDLLCSNCVWKDIMVDGFDLLRIKILSS